MNKKSKLKALRGDRIRSELRSMFSDIQEFSPIHLRLYGVVDVWPTTQKWYSAVLGRKGTFQETSDLMDVVEAAQKGANYDISTSSTGVFSKQTGFFDSNPPSFQQVDKSRFV